MKITLRLFLTLNSTMDRYAHVILHIGMTDFLRTAAFETIQYICSKSTSVDFF